MFRIIQTPTIALSSSITVAFTARRTMFSSLKSSRGKISMIYASQNLSPRYLYPIQAFFSVSGEKRSFASSINRIDSKNTSLYTWGTNKSGCLLQKYNNNGDGPEIVWEPKLAALSQNLLSDKIIDVSCGSSEIMLVTKAGRVWVAGENKIGNLGLGHTNPVTTLTELKVTAGGEERKNYDTNTVGEEILFKKGVIGSKSSALIAQNGDLYTFGNGGSLLSGAGALGLGNAKSYLRPELVQSLVEDGCMVQDVVLGESHSTVLTTEGEVLTCGAANYGRLGNGETSEDTLYFDTVEILPSENVIQIAGGESFTLALTKEGIIYGWGRNHKGQLGTGFGMAVDMYAMEQIPTPMDGDELINRTVTRIAAGTNHGACITSGGELFWWGSSLHLEPVRVDEVLHTKIIDVACGLDYTLALSEDHELFAFGAGKNGCLGCGNDNKTLHQAQMIRSLLRNDTEIVSISAGSNLASCLVVEK